MLAAAMEQEGADMPCVLGGGRRKDAAVSGDAECDDDDVQSARDIVRHRSSTTGFWAA